MVLVVNGTEILKKRQLTSIPRLGFKKTTLAGFGVSGSWPGGPTRTNKDYSGPL